MSQKRFNEAQISGLQVFQVIDMGNLLAIGAIKGEGLSFTLIPPGLDDLLSACTDDPHNSIGWVRELLDLETSPSVFASKLVAQGRFGIFLLVGFDGRLNAGYSDDWMYSDAKFVYGETYEEAWACGLDWAWTQRPWPRRLAIQTDVTPLTAEEIDEAESARGIIRAQPKGNQQ